MSQIRDLARAVSAHSEILTQSWHANEAHGLSSAEGRRTTIPPLDEKGEEARNQLIGALRELEQLVLGPKDTMQTLYYKVSQSPASNVVLSLRRRLERRSRSSPGSLSTSNPSTCSVGWIDLL